MNHHDIDPSLCAGEPLLESLEDGFSPPAETTAEEQEVGTAEPAERTLGPQSPF